MGSLWHEGSGLAVRVPLEEHSVLRQAHLSSVLVASLVCGSVGISVGSERVQHIFKGCACMCSPGGRDVFLGGCPKV